MFPCSLWTSPAMSSGVQWWIPGTCGVFTWRLHNWFPRETTFCGSARANSLHWMCRGVVLDVPREAWSVFRMVPQASGWGDRPSVGLGQFQTANSDGFLVVFCLGFSSEKWISLTAIELEPWSLDVVLGAAAGPDDTLLRGCQEGHCQGIYVALPLDKDLKFLDLLSTAWYSTSFWRFCECNVNVLNVFILSIYIYIQIDIMQHACLHLLAPIPSMFWKVLL